MNKKKKLLIILCSTLSSIILVTAALLFVIIPASYRFNLEVGATQVDDSQKITVVWDTSKKVSEVEVTISHKGSELSKTTISKQEDIQKASLVVDCYYGNMDVTVKAKRGREENTKTTSVKVYADEYNIAPITATMPVTLFSLNLNEITQNGEIPTFIWFKRGDVWNYNEMPNNVYIIPTVDADEIRTNGNHQKIYKKTSEWVKELYEINPDSHFNFYYNDYFAYGWLDATIANGIPSENYHVTLLSDGSASLTYFNKHFVADDTQYTSNYNTMKAEYETVKEQIAEKGYYTEGDNSFEIEAGKLREYAYIMAKEDSNVTWWLSATRNAIYDINNVDEGTTLKKTEVKALESEGKIVCKSLSNSFKALSAEEQANLKKLYSFGDDLFEEAENQGKKAMVILGTWQSNEDHFAEYVAATIAYYGTEDYVYYYKGHPRNPTPTVDGKMEYLNSLGLIDVDSTIAAELLFFYFPDLLVCTGYDSSTFVSLSNEQSGSIWNFNGGETGFAGSDKSYKSNIDSCFTVAEESNLQYGSFVVSGNKTILIEELTSTDIYLYDSVTKTMKHLIYNTNSSQYELAAE